MMSFRLAPVLVTLLATAGLAKAGQGDGPLPGAASPAPATLPKVEIAPLPAPPAAAPDTVATITPPAAQPATSVARWSATLVMHAESGKQPTSCALMDDGKTLVVSNRGDNSVSVFDS